MLNDSNNLISLTGHSLLNDLFNKNGGKNSDVQRLYKHILPEYCFWKTEQFSRFLVKNAANKAL